MDPRIPTLDYAQKRQTIAMEALGPNRPRVRGSCLGGYLYTLPVQVRGGKIAGEQKRLSPPAHRLTRDPGSTLEEGRRN